MSTHVSACQCMSSHVNTCQCISKHVNTFQHMEGGQRPLSHFFEDFPNINTNSNVCLHLLNWCRPSIQNSGHSSDGTAIQIVLGKFYKTIWHLSFKAVISENNDTLTMAATDTIVRYKITSSMIYRVSHKKFPTFAYSSEQKWEFFCGSLCTFLYIHAFHQKYLCPGNLNSSECWMSI